MSNNLWENLWSRSERETVFSYLERFYKLNSSFIDIFRDHGAFRVCDATCGYGAYSLALASNGFEVYSFDVSPTAAEFTRAGLEHYGLDAKNVKTADILFTGYTDGFFDSAVANSVLDHMTVSDAKKALSELCRITKRGGLIMVSFDRADEDDLSEPHELLPDGSILYTSGRRGGMVFHPYDEDEALRLLGGRKIVRSETNRQGELVYIFEEG